MNERAQHLKHWCTQQAPLKDREFEFTMVSGDASFRKYFRLKLKSESYIAVDAPPEHEDSRQFCKVANYFAEQGVFVPKVIANDFEQGFMLLSDLGDRQLLAELNEKSAQQYYALAFNELVKLQAASQSDRDGLSFLPLYDYEKLISEMALFQEWFCGSLLAIDLSSQESDLILRTEKSIVESVLKQKHVCVHRDFHSRNLMLLGDSEQTKIAVIDFQDAVVGPITYDAVSLLKDCYIEWPIEMRKQWLKEYYSQLQEFKIIESHSDFNKDIDKNIDKDFESFYRDFELMGLQRHFKILGIFARLSIRDGKDNYLNDLPLTFKYVEQTIQSFPEFSAFSDFFMGVVKEKFLSLELINK
jgi:aminoglycoside/choline kinase family phosphotransferase